MSSTPIDSAPMEPVERDTGPAEDSIKVVCRFRPLNDSEERAGSKFVVKFQDENCVSIGVSLIPGNSILFRFIRHSSLPLKHSELF